MDGKEICQILSLPYARLSQKEACERIVLAGKERRPLSVFTPGATIAAAAERDEGALRLLLGGDLILCDGVGSRLAARLCGESAPALVPGIELAEDVLKAGEKDGFRVFFYGAKKGVARDAAEAMQKRYPALCFAYADGYGDDPIERVRAFAPHVVFVCLGFPRQEEWILRHRDMLACPALGLGGSFDVWAGRVRRAPKAWRRLGLEWLWRTACEPRRVFRLLPLAGYFFRSARCGARKLLHKRQKREENMSESGEI